MSKRKQKTKKDKVAKKHDFNHLTRTKISAGIVKSEKVDNKEIQVPLELKIKKDLRIGIITIVIFVIVILVMWYFLGKNGEIYNLTTKLNLF